MWPAYDDCSTATPFRNCALERSPICACASHVHVSQPHNKSVFAAGKGSKLVCPPHLGPQNFVFDSALASSALLIPQAGHAQFWCAPGCWQAVSNCVSGKGSVSDADVRQWAAALLVGYLLPHLPVHSSQVRHAYVRCLSVQSRVQAASLAPHHVCLGRALLQSITDWRRTAAYIEDANHTVSVHRVLVLACQTFRQWEHTYAVRVRNQGMIVL